MQAACLFWWGWVWLLSGGIGGGSQGLFIRWNEWLPKHHFSRFQSPLDIPSSLNSQPTTSLLLWASPSRTAVLSGREVYGRMTLATASEQMDRTPAPEISINTTNIASRNCWSSVIWWHPFIAAPLPSAINMECRDPTQYPVYIWQIQYQQTITAVPNFSGSFREGHASRVLASLLIFLYQGVYVRMIPTARLYLYYLDESIHAGPCQMEGFRWQSSPKRKRAAWISEMRMTEPEISSIRAFKWCPLHCLPSRTCGDRRSSGSTRLSESGTYYTLIPALSLARKYPHSARIRLIFCKVSLVRYIDSDSILALVADAFR